MTKEVFDQIAEGLQEAAQVARSDELVECVARAMCKADGYDDDDPADYEFMNKMARAAIAVVLEEAAKVAEEIGTFHLCAPDEGTYTVWTARKTAAAIRNLIGEK